MSYPLGVVSKPRSTTVNRTGGWRTQRPEFNEELCRGCETCTTVCPEGCVYPVGSHRYEVDLDYCKGCGLCAAECEGKAIKMVPEVR